MARERRSKKEVIIDKIKMTDEKINEYTSKIENLQEQKEELQNQLEEITAAEQKAEEEAQMKALMSLMKEKSISVSEIENLITNPKKD